MHRTSVEALAHAANGAMTFAYDFDVLPAGAPPSLEGAPHASERAYVFGTLDLGGFAIDDRDRDVAVALATRWTGFARIGVSAAPGQVEWPQVATALPAILRLSWRGATVEPIPLRVLHPPAGTALACRTPSSPRMIAFDRDVTNQRAIHVER